MGLALQSFGVKETHGILSRPGNQIAASSDGRHWTAMYASLQREMPYEGVFDPVKDQLIVLHRDGPVRVERTRGPGRGSHLVPAGGMHLIPGGTEFGVRLAGVLNTLHVYVRRSVLEEVAAEMVEGDPSRIEIPPNILDTDPSLAALLEAVVAALASDDAGTAFYSDYLSRVIAAHLIRAYSRGNIKNNRIIGASGYVTQSVADAIEYMRANLDRPIGLDDIANAVHRSPSHFARIFRADLGMPPHRYLINLRVEKAQFLLEKTNASIAEIAYECGFSHQEHLTRLFRRLRATTPAAFRRSRRN